MNEEHTHWGDKHDVDRFGRSRETSTLTLKNVVRYLRTRPSTLCKLPEFSWEALLPLEAAQAMSLRNWNFFAQGFMAWTIDSMDFFCVSACASTIAESFGVNTTQITWGITLVLMFRSLGAVIFGLLGDRYGRKWPLVFCYLGFTVLQIATGFVNSYGAFLAVRALFGILMGGCWSLAAATAIEDAPTGSRSLLSGLFLSGYCLGYIFAVIFWRAFEFTKHTWRALFWFTAAPSFLLMIWRVPYPETNYFMNFRKARDTRNMDLASSEAGKGGETILTFLREDWLTFIFLILLLAGFNFLAHGSQDLLPTYLKKQVGLGADAITVTMVVVNLGGIIGGLIFGQLMEVLGRRLVVIVSSIGCGAFIYPTFFLHSESAVCGSGFMLVLFVFGAWSTATIMLFELTAHSKYRSMFSGLAYQLGNLASSASSTIESDLGANFPLQGKASGDYNYGKVMAIFMGCVVGYMILVAFFGFERFHVELVTTEMQNEENEENEAVEKEEIHEVEDAPWHTV
ncbi:DEKNAAC104364 [Brettanomyces naardenensis]|uniref:DEKNAAC104364 n=1 Tax=Brettanomyces naardenensis TaxID=13370 RepID=A0A448YQQ0_BRENA|nr:DEKNAAC104364 [Brettanomyces naardenensis]